MVRVRYDVKMAILDHAVLVRLLALSLTFALQCHASDGAFLGLFHLDLSGFLFVAVEPGDIPTNRRGPVHRVVFFNAEIFIAH